MLEIIGDIVTLDSTEYLVICKKKVDNKEPYIVSSVTTPCELKLMEIREGDKGQVLGRLYDGEDQQTIIQESAQKIMEALRRIREQTSKKASAVPTDALNQN